MGVDQARGGGPSAQVDDPGLFPHQRDDLGVAAEAQDPAVPDRQGLCHMTVRIEGLDPAIEEDQIGDQGRTSDPRVERIRACRSGPDGPRGQQDQPE